MLTAPDEKLSEYPLRNFRESSYIHQQIKTMMISKHIKQASELLKGSGSPRFEAELLLSHVLKKNRSYLLAYPEQVLNTDQICQFETLVKRRNAGEPIAYLVEEKEFWSLSFHVTPETLIPRPETELLVEQVLDKLPKEKKQRVADLGTGSGAIALAIASERPNWVIVAIDASEMALEVARGNAKHLEIANVSFFHGDWCDALPCAKYDAIVSNPPYIDRKDRHLSEGDVRFEPTQALISGEGGVKDLSIIISQARSHLSKKGWLLLEHGYAQGEAVRQKMRQAGYQEVQTCLDLAGQERVTLGTV